MSAQPEFLDYEEHRKRAALVQAHDDFYFYTRYMFLRRKRFRWRKNWHHEKICDALMRVYRGECNRLIINVPPRYSKTEIAVVSFMSWCFGQNPDCEFIHTSYSGRLAARNSWETREVVSEPAFKEIFPKFEGLRQDSTARDDWRTIEGGCAYAVGSGGTITGYGAGKDRPGFGGAIIIDDPHKADEASSDVVRKGVIEWFQNTLESRKNTKDTPMIVIMQRLHEDDLSGWLLKGGNGESWEHVCIPAYNEVDPTSGKLQVESLPSYEVLWPEKHTPEMLRMMAKASPYVFAGQYLQRPSPLQGGTFNPDKIEIIPAVPAGIKMIRGWDLGSTVDGDPTASMKIGKLPDGRYVIADVINEGMLPHDVESCIKNTTARDGCEVQCSIPQDPGQAGKSQVARFVAMLAGYDVRTSPESGDKVTRANPFAAQVNVGNVMMVKAPWNDAVVNQMRHFPNGVHDDIIDAGSRAFNAFQDNVCYALEYMDMLAKEMQAKQQQ